MGSYRSLAIRAGRNIFTNPPKRVLWGVAPTGEPHFGYVLPVLTMQRLRAHGTQVVPLIANWHGYLDSQKTEWESIAARTGAYQSWFRKVGFENVVETKEFYLEPDYIKLLFKAAPFFGLSDCVTASRSTLRSRSSHETAADVLYTVTQTIDVVYLNVDCALCGEDEAPIYEYGLPILAMVAGHCCVGAYVSMAPGLETREMHASSSWSNKLTFSDDPQTLEAKIRTHVRRSAALGCSPPLLEFVCGPIAELLDLDFNVEAIRAAVSDVDRLGTALTTLVMRIFAATQIGEGENTS